MHLIPRLGRAVLDTDPLHWPVRRHQGHQNPEHSIKAVRVRKEKRRAHTELGQKEIDLLKVAVNKPLTQM